MASPSQALVRSLLCCLSWKNWTTFGQEAPLVYIGILVDLGQSGSFFGLPTPLAVGAIQEGVFALYALNLKVVIHKLRLSQTAALPLSGDITRQGYQVYDFFWTFDRLLWMQMEFGHLHAGGRNVRSATWWWWWKPSRSQYSVYFVYCSPL